MAQIARALSKVSALQQLNVSNVGATLRGIGTVGWALKHHKKLRVCWMMQVLSSHQLFFACCLVLFTPDKEVTGEIPKARSCLHVKHPHSLPVVYTLHCKEGGAACVGTSDHQSAAYG